LRTEEGSFLERYGNTYPMPKATFEALAYRPKKSAPLLGVRRRFQATRFVIEIVAESKERI